MIAFLKQLAQTLDLSPGVHPQLGSPRR
jgi:hypothetical protein